MNNIFLYGLILLGLVLVFMNKNKNVEGYNDHTGTFCTSCKNKTFNECMRCFNCGILKDKYGRSTCVGGDVHGPYNYEVGLGGTWHSGDPYSYAIRKNKENVASMLGHFKCKCGGKCNKCSQGRNNRNRCSGGPSNASRALGAYAYM